MGICALLIALAAARACDAAIRSRDRRPVGRRTEVAR
jgi:hypothetical protein